MNYVRTQELSLDEMGTQKGRGIAYRIWNGEELGTKSSIECYATYIGAMPIVAGYKPNWILLVFAAKPDANGYMPVDEAGNIIADPQRTLLYTAFYGFKVDDQDAAFEDLTHKLTLVYGDVDMTVEDVNVWYGADGTMVSVKKDGGWSNGTNIFITYGCAEGDQWLLDAQAAVDRDFAEDVEGL